MSNLNYGAQLNIVGQRTIIFYMNYERLFFITPQVFLVVFQEILVNLKNVIRVLIQRFLQIFPLKRKISRSYIRM